MTNTPDKSEMLPCAEFLCDRLDEFAHAVDSETAHREFYGHVAPALARLRSAIAASSRPPADQVPDMVPVTKADRELYKFILDAPYATCNRIDNMPDDAPELQQIARHRLPSVAALKAVPRATERAWREGFSTGLYAGDREHIEQHWANSDACNFTRQEAPAASEGAGEVTPAMIDAGLRAIRSEKSKLFSCNRTEADERHGMHMILDAALKASGEE